MTTHTDFPICWSISDGAAGHTSQVRGLCEAIGFQTQLFTARLKRPWNLLPGRIVPITHRVIDLQPIDGRESTELDGQPQLVVTCGRQSIPFSLLQKKRRGASVFTVHLQSPNVPLDRFDLIVAPEHDQLSGSNVISIPGAMHTVTPQTLADARQRVSQTRLSTLGDEFVAVLLGGPNRYYAFDEHDVDRLMRKLLQTAMTGRRLAIIPSRRTPEEAIERIASLLGKKHLCWDGEGENPYLPALAASTHIIVTGDSVSMLSEAIATGKPVFCEQLRERKPSRKFRHFHQSLIDGGYVRPFAGRLESWSYVPPNPTVQIAEHIRGALGLSPDSSRRAA